MTAEEEFIEEHRDAIRQKQAAGLSLRQALVCVKAQLAQDAVDAKAQAPILPSNGPSKDGVWRPSKEEASAMVGLRSQVEAALAKYQEAVRTRESLDELGAKLPLEMRSRQERLRPDDSAGASAIAALREQIAALPLNIQKADRTISEAGRDLESASHRAAVAINSLLRPWIEGLEASVSRYLEEVFTYPGRAAQRARDTDLVRNSRAFASCVWDDPNNNVVSRATGAIEALKRIAEGRLPSLSAILAKK